MGAYENAPASFCGDGVQSAGEACDEGAQNGTYGHCKADCTGLGPHCGDGTQNGPEQCDDGNASTPTLASTRAPRRPAATASSARASSSATTATWSNTDACLNTCAAAACGDGFVRAGVEQCDDGNMVNTDACLNTCAAATCGDGFVRAGVEHVRRRQHEQHRRLPQHVRRGDLRRRRRPGGRRAVRRRQHGRTPTLA
jgi:cysteine-rich repeat protein